MGGCETSARFFAVALRLLSGRGSRSVVGLCALTLSLASPSFAKVPSAWPPPAGPGTLFVHIGEEHVTDEDGPRILPRVAQLAAAYRPAAVLASGDKANDGTTENFALWKEALAPLFSARIPVFPAVGNHDRKHKPGFPEGIDPTGDLANYESFFADQPYPFGDAAPPLSAGFAPRSRPVEDPPGASSHYDFDLGGARWIVLDNSCFTINFCDPLQNPPFPDPSGAGSQFEFLEQRAEDAKSRGMRVFVVMHMPTQDPRPGHTQPTPLPHTMGEGTAPDNAQFEQAAAAADIDGVFAGHVKGMWTYEAAGVEYFTDGGAGGAVYVGDGEETGVDYGYWHGLRLMRIGPGGALQTDAVPVFDSGAITIKGAERIRRRDVVGYAATGRQPTEEGPAVDLELRPPDPARPNASNLPTPAYVWTTGDRTVMRPQRAPGDDARDDPRTQTQTGRFRAVCPGRTSVGITAGTTKAIQRVTVPARRGPIVRSIRPRASTLRAGRSRALAAVRLAQPARVRATLRRRGRVIKTLVYLCRNRGRMTVRWDGLLKGTNPAPAGRYGLVVRVLSDRQPLAQRYALRLLAG